MDRLDKIFTIMVMAGLIALLVCSRRRANVPQLNMSVAPSLRAGPSYLLQALPSRRRCDDYADAVSYYQGLGGGTSLEDGWGGQDGDGS